MLLALKESIPVKFMQLFAFDSNRKIVRAPQAKRKCRYYCLECESAVCVRGGLQRQPHFYHLEQERECRQKGKSLIHLSVQKYLEEQLPFELDLEVRFPEIKRIADAVWHPLQIVFEVQCSPISSHEVLQRNLDYASIGYQVVWILHDKRFNQASMTSAEALLRNHPHYFTNMNSQGFGIIYDQWDAILKGRRQILQQKWPVYFDRDFPELLDEQLKRRNSKSTQENESKGFSDLWKNFVLRPYDLFIQMSLEGRCSKFKPDTGCR